MSVQDRSLRDIAQAIRDRAISCEDVARTFLRNSQQSAALNAFVSLNDHLLEDARRADELLRDGKPVGALHGVPLTLKDNIDTCALPTTAGTPALRNNLPARDALIASRLFEAGALLLGKTGLHELAFGATSNNRAFGPIRNPYDDQRIPGGSSGGTAAAVASRSAPAGIGTDTGGSVRVPAGLCGISGFRPTVGRWSQQGIVPISATRDTAGPMARSVDDLILLDEVVTGDANAVRFRDLVGVRIGLPRRLFWEQLDPETEKLCAAAVDAARRAGAVLVEVDIANLAAMNEAVSFVVALHEARTGLAAYLTAAGSKSDFRDLAQQIASPDVRALFDGMFGPSAEARSARYVEVMAHDRPEYVRRVDAYFEDNALDAMLFPTSPLPASPIGQDDTVRLNGVSVPVFATYIRNTDPGSVVGLPGVSVPAGLTSGGLPVGISLDGPRGSDRRLLGIAQVLEAALTRTPAPNLAHLRS